MVPGDRMTLLFADTLIEDEGTYAFIDAGAKALGLEVTRIADGRTPFEVFRDKRFLGNSRVDPCSLILKRELLAKWHKAAAEEGPITVVVGLDWTELDRLERFRERITHPVLAPLYEFGIDKPAVHQMVADAGLPEQRLYQLGMPHANCGGGCVKMGQSGWELLYRAMPERYARWEAEEETLRDMLGDVSILRDRTGGESRPLPLREFRERIEVQPQLIPPDEWGGCGCAIE